MIYIAIGMVGFLAAYIFDIVSIKKIPRLKGLVWGVAVVAVIYSACMVCLDPAKFTLPSWATVIGWVLLPAFIFSFIYSLFINLPFRKTYVKTGVGNELVRTGTYALVRHPGVLWYGMILIALILISKSQLLLIAAPIWLSMDIVHVVIQDRLLFSKMFDEYEDYRRQTPMLIPTRKSIIAFFKTLRSTT